MSKNIEKLCDLSVELAIKAIVVHSDINIYCNNVAKKILNDDDFEFDTLPDPIVEVLFYGGVKPDCGWVEFIIKNVREELERENLIK